MYADIPFAVERAPRTTRPQNKPLTGNVKAIIKQAVKRLSKSILSAKIKAASELEEVASEYAGACEELVAAGALPYLCGILDAAAGTSTVTATNVVLSLLEALVGVPACIRAMLASGAVSQLVKLLGPHTDLKINASAVAILAALHTNAAVQAAQDPPLPSDLRAVIRDAGGLAALVQLMQRPAGRTPAEGSGNNTAVLKILAEAAQHNNASTRAVLVQHGGLGPLQKLAKGTGAAATEQMAALQLMMTLSTDLLMDGTTNSLTEEGDRFLAAIVKARGLHILAQLHSSSDAMQFGVSFTLLCLLVQGGYGAQLAAIPGAVGPFVGNMCGTRCPVHLMFTQRTLAVKALCKMAAAGARQAVLAAGALPAAEALLGSLDLGDAEQLMAGQETALLLTLLVCQPGEQPLAGVASETIVRKLLQMLKQGASIQASAHALEALSNTMRYMQPAVARLLVAEAGPFVASMLDDSTGKGSSQGSSGKAAGAKLYMKEGAASFLGNLFMSVEDGQGSSAAYQLAAELQLAGRLTAAAGSKHSDVHRAGLDTAAKLLEHARGHASKPGLTLEVSQETYEVAELAVQLAEAFRAAGLVDAVVRVLQDGSARSAAQEAAARAARVLVWQHGMYAEALQSGLLQLLLAALESSSSREVVRVAAARAVAALWVACGQHGKIMPELHLGEAAAGRCAKVLLQLLLAGRPDRDCVKPVLSALKAVASYGLAGEVRELACAEVGELIQLLLPAAGQASGKVSAAELAELAGRLVARFPGAEVGDNAAVAAAAAAASGSAAGASSSSSIASAVGGAAAGGVGVAGGGGSGARRSGGSSSNNSSSSSKDASCAQCNATAGGDIKLQCCAACKQVWYCGAICQRFHWPVHKAECRAARGK